MRRCNVNACSQPAALHRKDGVLRMRRCEPATYSESRPFQALGRDRSEEETEPAKLFR